MAWQAGVPWEWRAAGAMAGKGDDETRRWVERGFASGVF
jgi:hypothetical protein